MTTENSLVVSLRQQIERKYREAIQALETLSEYLEGNQDGPSTKSPAAVFVSAPFQVPGGTTVEQVLAVLGDTHKTVQQIHAETGISEESVRAVLYSKFVKPKLHRKKVGKRTGFRMLRATANSSAFSSDSNGEKKSAAALVREVIAKYPDGLTAAAITAAVGEQVEKMTGSRAAIGAALYNGKNRGQLIYHEGSGTYSLARRKS
ncbi:MAG: hypothetical protein WD071_09555 [Pseudohongiella sp.]|uniref:hypothetical protein n=1 Tax=Pseudohongiella sp. TaxID=1979412 RepID=UPI0034A09BF4